MILIKQNIANAASLLLDTLTSPALKGSVTMPLFDYHCPRCQNDCELLVSGEAKPVCPNCGSRKLEKLVSAPAAPGRSKAILQRARRQAAKEGHFSHYSKKERPRLS